MTSKTFCSLPWVNISVDPDGSIKPCCVSTDYIKRPDGKKFNLGYDNIDDIINSVEYHSIRNKMLSGEEVEGCRQCYTQENLNGKSQRMLHNEKWKNVAFSKMGKKQISSIEYFDLRFGNMCNLTCRSCFPGYSSQVEKEVAQHETLQRFHPLIQVDMNKWYTTDVFKENVRLHEDNIRQLYITGGEPTIISQNYTLLESLVDTGRSKKITLQVNTNMTNLQSKWIDLLKEFKEVLLFVSIDGIGSLQEYIRHPSSWSQIDKNFKSLMDRKVDSIKIIPTPVLQSYNIGLISDLLEYFESFNRTAGECVVNVMPIVLESPSYLNFEHLPYEYKQECKERLNQWIDESCRYQTDIFYQRMKSVNSKLDSSGDITKLIEFIDFTETYDSIRKESIKDVNAELWEACCDYTDKSRT